MDDTIQQLFCISQLLLLDRQQQPLYLEVMKLGKRLRHARERRKLTQDELSALASTPAMPISQAMISALENRDSETTTALFVLARALRINPEWLQTGEPQNDSGLDTDAWKPPSAELDKDEKSLLKDYQKASDGWKLTLRLMARTPPEEQPTLSKNMNILMTTIFGSAVQDERLGDNWLRPDKPKEPKK